MRIDESGIFYTAAAKRTVLKLMERVVILKLMKRAEPFSNFWREQKKDKDQEPLIMKIRDKVQKKK